MITKVGVHEPEYISDTGNKCFVDDFIQILFSRKVHFAYLIYLLKHSCFKFNKVFPVPAENGYFEPAVGYVSDYSQYKLKI